MSSTLHVRLVRRSVEPTWLSHGAEGYSEAVRVLVHTRNVAVQAKSRAVCHLKALVVTAATPLRHQLHPLQYADRPLCTAAQQCIKHCGTVMALRASARRILALEAEANDLEAQIEYGSGRCRRSCWTSPAGAR